MYKDVMLMTLDFDAFCFWRRKSGCRVEEWRRCNFIEPNSEGKRLFITVHKRHHSPTTTISCNFLYTSTWTFAAISYNENRRWIMQMNYFSVTHQPRRLHVGVGGIHYQHYHLFSDNWSYTTYGPAHIVVVTWTGWQCYSVVFTETDSRNADSFCAC